MNLLRAFVFAVASLFVSAAAYAAPICPVLTGADSTYTSAITAASGNCNTIITINANGTLTFTYPNANPYDGNDDNYVGVVNNFGTSINALTLNSNTDIFGFDGDGIDAYGISGNPIDTATYGAGAYGGADAYFSNISTGNSKGTVRACSH